MKNMEHKVRKGSFMFPFKINKLNYNLNNPGRRNLHILPNLCERAQTPVPPVLLCFTFAVRSQKQTNKKKQKEPASLPS